MEILKISSKSNPNSVAGAIAGLVKESNRAEMQAIGAGALNQAVKAVAIARGFVAPAGVPGKGYRIHVVNGKKIAVINLIGRVDVGILSENPFLKADKILEEIHGKADIVIVDFHAEATAEKIAMGYYLDGRVTCVFGTHTHVQTADETILEKGTAYITDVGMTGPKKSVIGMDPSASIKRFVTTLPERYKVSDDKNVELTGCILELDDENCQMKKISRIKL